MAKVVKTKSKAKTVPPSMQAEGEGMFGRYLARKTVKPKKKQAKRGK